VNSAHDVLKDDQQLTGLSIFRFERPSHQPRVFRQALRLSFADATFGGTKTPTIPTTTACKKCHADGTHDAKRPAVCRLCMGRGFITEGFQRMPGYKESAAPGAMSEMAGRDGVGATTVASWRLNAPCALHATKTPRFLDRSR
jgi:hypothetical protein